MFIHRRAPLLLLAAVCAAPAAHAQLNNPWVTFVQDSSRIKNPNGTVHSTIANDQDEKDYAYGDLNRDGWTDLIVVRKQPAATTGKRVNYLLMNENGTLVDRTTLYATDSDYPGDSGFNTPTNDRDVQIVDLDGDGWPEVVTATTLSDGDPKYLSHPRVYRNKGAINGEWQGLRYEDARIPQLLTVGGLAVAPRFCAVAVGDVTGDGFPDLYFSDYDSTETNIGEPTSWDLNDRLLVNDGFGYFTDSGTTRMSSTMLLSAFGMAAKIIDVNGDGVNDVVKDTALAAPQYVAVAYNNPANVGFFNLFQSDVNQAAPYHVDVADMNRDGRPDVIISDDGQDSYRYNTGNDGLGRATWGALKTYQFLNGADDGFAGNCYIADLNNDGWPDTMHADFDVDVLGCAGRLHIYHNPGGNPGDQITLREEIQMNGSAGWKGAVGLLENDLRGTYDVAIFDIDNDGDLDMVIGRCTGTFVWMNQLNQPSIVSQYCFGDGTATACPCGNNSAVGAREGCLNSLGLGGKLTASGYAKVTTDTLTLRGTRMPNSSALFFQGTAQASGGLGTVFGDGLRCAAGAVIRLGTKLNVAGASNYPEVGDMSISLKGVVPAGATRMYQVWYRNAAAFCNAETFNLSNGTQVVWAP